MRRHLLTLGCFVSLLAGALWADDKQGSRPEQAAAGRRGPDSISRATSGRSWPKSVSPATAPPSNAAASASTPRPSCSRAATAVPSSSRATRKASRLLHLVAGLDPEVKAMPPAPKPPLSAAEIGKLRAWIDQGAKWPKDVVLTGTEKAKSNHWAYQADPASAAAGRVRRMGALQRHRPLRPGPAGEGEADDPPPEADRVTLIRRLSLDLLGLPPTPEEVDDFVGDTRPDAYETPRRSAAGVAALRRALGPALARPGPLRRQRRLREGHRPALRLALPRLGHRRPQPRPAVRPVHHRAAGRRPAAERHAGAEDRDRLPPQHADQPRGRRRSGAVPRRGRRRSRQHHRPRSGSA